MTDLDDFLAHYGVKGMKWGKRKARGESYSDQVMKATPGAAKTRVIAKNGDVLSVEKEPIGPVAVAVAKLTGRKPADNVSSMSIRNSSGEKVGSFQVWKDGPGVVRGEWLEIKSSHQGRGYSEAAIRALIGAAKKDSTLKEVRLQVPTDAAPAKHIYGKIGFVKDIDLGHDPFYGGLEDWVYKV